jgi:membrane protein CcdC involved in cytochrome C biogenesis
MCIPSKIVCCSLCLQFSSVRETWTASLCLDIQARSIWLWSSIVCSSFCIQVQFGVVYWRSRRACQITETLKSKLGYIIQCISGHKILDNGTVYLRNSLCFLIVMVLIVLVLRLLMKTIWSCSLSLKFLNQFHFFISNMKINFLSLILHTEQNNNNSLRINLLTMTHGKRITLIHQWTNI